MLSYTSLSPDLRYALTGVLFMAVAAQFALIIYKFPNARKALSLIWDVILFVSLVVFISYLAGASSMGNVVYEVNIPYPAVVAVTALTFINAAAGFALERKRNRNRLTPNSVKQALDNLSSGICFAAPDGRIVLINYIFANLVLSETGSYPQMLSEIDSLFSDSEYRSKDGKIWTVKTTPLSDEGLEGYTQTTVVEVTELVNANKKLEEENVRLKEANDEVQAMIERLADRIREQETLNIKMQVHNDIGTSLIAISKIMKGSGGNADAEIAQLRNAVSYFSDYRKTREVKTLGEAAASAEELGLELVIDNRAELSEFNESLIAAAVSECITNSIKHAKASKLTVIISEDENSVKAEISNNGIPPETQITEGGGLSSLRRKLEDAGGKMTVISEPGFMLVAQLRKENCYD